MCIICYKPEGIGFPSVKTMRACWDNNPDGAGYMYASNGKVTIRKGFMDFDSFLSSLDRDIDKVGYEPPFVMHFRISTQAGVRQDCCHPFPLSSDMGDLRKLTCESDIGIAHNGIIPMYSDNAKTHSDTMAYITRYLSYLICRKDYYTDSFAMHMISEPLNSSRLAILDSDGHCELIGNWIKEGELYYSCGSYIPMNNFFRMDYSYDPEFWTYNDFEKAYNEDLLLYEFKADNCPWSICFDSSYCESCHNFGFCKYQEEIEEDIESFSGEFNDER